MAKIFQLKIQLNNFKPSTFRTILIKPDMSFYKLHYVILETFNFSGGHMYAFTLPGPNSEIITSDPLYKLEEGEIDARKTKVQNFFDAVGQKCLYEYDFGDSWRFTVLLQKICDSKDLKVKKFPHLLKFKGPMLLDDIGGPWTLSEIQELYKKGDFKKIESEYYLEREIVEDMFEYDWDDFSLC